MAISPAWLPCVCNFTEVSTMWVTQVVYYYVLSALLFISLIWLSDVLYIYIYTAYQICQNQYLTLINCILTCFCDIAVLILSELQLNEDETCETSQLCSVAERLIEVREWAAQSKYWHSSSLLLYVYDQLWGMLTICKSSWCWSWLWAVYSSLTFLSLSDEIDLVLNILWLHYTFFIVRNNILDKISLLSSSSELCITDFETWLQNYSACFYIFFITSSVKYILLDTVWVWLTLNLSALTLSASNLSASDLSALKHNQLLLVRHSLKCFIIAAFIICAIVIELTL